jgi:hypothetical protein
MLRDTKSTGLMHFFQLGVGLRGAARLVGQVLLQALRLLDQGTGINRKKFFFAIYENQNIGQRFIIFGEDFSIFGKSICGFNENPFYLTQNAVFLFFVANRHFCGKNNDEFITSAAGHRNNLPGGLFFRPQSVLQTFGLLFSLGQGLLVLLRQLVHPVGVVGLVLRDHPLQLETGKKALIYQGGNVSNCLNCLNPKTA